MPDNNDQQKKDGGASHAPEDHSSEQGDMSKDKIEGDAARDAEKLKSGQSK